MSRKVTYLYSDIFTNEEFSNEGKVLWKMIKGLMDYIKDKGGTSPKIGKVTFRKPRFIKSIGVQITCSMDVEMEDLIHG